VRPEAVELSKTPLQGADNPNASESIVDSVLFNGANSMVILRDPKSGETLQVTLPQTGAFLGLTKGETVFTSWNPTQARCFVSEGP